MANAQLEALARGYANVASLVVIPVLDIGIYRRTLDELQQGAVTTSGRRWGVTGDYFVGFVADCIERLRQGTAPAGAYVVSCSGSAFHVPPAHASHSPTSTVLMTTAIWTARV